MQQKGIKNKNSFVKEVPNEIDVLNEYRQKYDLKRKYATPILERDGDIHCFDEEFYNKARQPEIKYDAHGSEYVESRSAKREATYNIY
jgi:hypothetical protein